MSSYLRGSKLGLQGCHVKLGASMTNRYTYIRAAQFVIDDERRHWTKAVLYIDICVLLR